MSTTAITEAIKTLAEAERIFNLQRTEDEEFFLEWQTNLPNLSDAEKTELHQLRKRYLYQRSQSHLLEQTVMLLFASPLLAIAKGGCKQIAGFYDPPFQLRAEESVQINLADSEEVLQGRIDVLVLSNQLWVVVLESKKTAISVLSALPQTLAYLMANPQPTQPSFAMMTNGDDVLFVKLALENNRKYALSRIFSAFVSNQEIYSILQILKTISQGFDSK